MNLSQGPKIRGRGKNLRIIKMRDTIIDCTENGNIREYQVRSNARHRRTREIPKEVANDEVPSQVANPTTNGNPAEKDLTTDFSFDSSNEIFEFSLMNNESFNDSTDNNSLFEFILFNDDLLTRQDEFHFNLCDYMPPMEIDGFNNIFEMDIF